MLLTMLFNRRTAIPLIFYIYIIQTRYLIGILQGKNIATGPQVWLIGAAHMAIASWICWEVLPAKRKVERRVLLGTASLVAAALAFLVWTGYTGLVEDHLREYFILTISCAWACATGFWVAIDLWARGYGILARGPAAVAAWFSFDVAANVAYTYVPWVWDANEHLRMIVTGGHLVVMLVVLRGLRSIHEDSRL